MTSENPMASALERTKLPGFGLPVDYMPKWRKYDNSQRFPHAIADNYTCQGLTYRERRMLDFINQITDKPEWERKVFDESIVSKWRDEASKYSEEEEDVILSEPMFDYCIEELRDKAKRFREFGFVDVLDAEVTVVKSDSTISAELQQALRDHVKLLENVPDRLKDWHPGSDEKVLDLLHPSLFPLVYGVSRVLPEGVVPLKDCVLFTGKGEETEIMGDEPPTHRRSISWSDANLPAWGSYQWLPSDIHFDSEGSTKIVSYINNLHPDKHPELYKVLEQFVGRVIPLWDETLSWFHERIRIKIGMTSDEDYYIPDGLKYERPKVEDEEMEKGSDESESDESEPDLYDDDYREWWTAHRVLNQPEPCKFVPWAKKLETEPSGASPVDLKKDFAESGLQVIFKLANIHLTPEKQEYEGGTWHIEGALNEHICATALYYYDEQNVTESSLAFRQTIDSEEMSCVPAQNEWDSMIEYFGTDNEETTLMELGSVVTREGRLLTFPNVLQHRVSSFKLADPSKPGHRKILAMFLVDPHIRILSTANVPPQQADWWAPEVQKADQLEALPQELFDNIVGKVGGLPMSWDDALETREKLMAERGALAKELNDMFESDKFSFCEH